MTFYDASQRYYELVNISFGNAYDHAVEQMNSGDLAGAYFAFQALGRYADSKDRMAAIENSWDTNRNPRPTTWNRSETCIL